MGDDDLHKRIEALEKQLAELQRRLPPESDPLSPRKEPPLPIPTDIRPLARPTFESLPPKASIAGETKPAPPEAPTSANFLKSGENWLARIGIGLLIIGVCFFLKFSFDRGWISPVVRIFIGGAVAVALMVLGEALRTKRARYAQLLSGGGMATAYGVILAAHHLYHLIGDGATLVLLVLVAAECFVQSLRFESPVLGIIATAGAYLSPYLLLLRNGTLGNLSLYYGIIIAVVYGIYARKEWKALFFTGLIGAWIGLSVPLGIAAFSHGWWFDFISAGEWQSYLRILKKTSVDARIAASVLILIWLGANAVTSYRMRVSRGKAIGEFYTSVLLAPIITLHFVLQAFDMHGRTPFGELALAFAGISFALSGLAWFRGWKNLVRGNAISGTLLLFLSLPALISGNALFFTGIALAWAVHFIGRKANDMVFRIFGHVASAYVYLGAVVGYLLLTHYGRIFSFADPKILTAILCNCGILFIASTLFDPLAKHLYRIAAWLGFFLLLYTWSDAKDIAWIYIGLVLALYGTGLRLVNLWKKFSDAEFFGHIALYASLLIAMIYALVEPHPSAFAFRAETFSLLAVLLLGIAAMRFPQERLARVTYQVGAHVLLLIAVWHEFGDYAPQLVSMTWAIYAILLMVASVRHESVALRSFGISTLVVLLIRLFAVDTAQLDPIWRIVVFIGVGLLLLLGAYFLPRVIRKTSEPD